MKREKTDNKEIPEGSIMPQEASEWYKRFCTPIRMWAFLSAVIIGFITHLFMFTNTFLNHDWALNIVREDLMWNIGQGRWTSNIVRSFLSTDYSMGWVISLYSILFLALTSVILTELSKIKQKPTAVMVSGFLVTFPVVASSFSYMPFCDGYFVSAFLAALAVLLTEKYKFGFLAGIPMAIIILGIYQPYFAFMVMLSVLCLLLAAFDPEKTKLKVLRHVGLAAFGIGVYYPLTRLVLKIMNMSFVGYQGASQFSVGRLRFSAIMRFVQNAYTEFWLTIREVLSGGNVFNFRQFLIWVMFVSLVVALIMMVKRSKAYKSLPKMTLIVALIIVTPLINSFAYVISESTFYHMLMKYSYVVLFVAVPVLFEKLGLKKIKIASGVVCGLLIFQFLILANLGYYNMQRRYESDYAKMVRIVERIESHPDYQPGMPVTVKFDFKEPYMHSGSFHDQLCHMIGMDTESMLYWNNFYEFADKVLNVPLVNGLRELDRLSRTTEYNEMAFWPDSSSVGVIDGVIVAKIR